MISSSLIRKRTRSAEAARGNWPPEGGKTPHDDHAPLASQVQPVPISSSTKKSLPDEHRYTENAGAVEATLDSDYEQGSTNASSPVRKRTRSAKTATVNWPPEGGETRREHHGALASEVQPAVLLPPSGPTSLPYRQLRVRYALPFFTNPTTLRMMFGDIKIDLDIKKKLVAVPGLVRFLLGPSPAAYTTQYRTVATGIQSHANGQVFKMSNSNGMSNSMFTQQNGDI